MRDQRTTGTVGQPGLSSFTIPQSLSLYTRPLCVKSAALFPPLIPPSPAPQSQPQSSPSSSIPGQRGRPAGSTTTPQNAGNNQVSTSFTGMTQPSIAQSVAPSTSNVPGKGFGNTHLPMSAKSATYSRRKSNNERNKVQSPYMGKVSSKIESSRRIKENAQNHQKSANGLSYEGLMGQPGFPVQLNWERMNKFATTLGTLAAKRASSSVSFTNTQSPNNTISMLQSAKTDSLPTASPPLPKLTPPISPKPPSVHPFYNQQTNPMPQSMQPPPTTTQPRQIPPQPRQPSYNQQMYRRFGQGPRDF